VGAPAARITREEFVTPPEFRGLESVQHPAARVGGVRIELIRSGAETRLGSCYQQIPVRVMPPFSFDAE
jgi:urease accessory protein